MRIINPYTEIYGNPNPIMPLWGCLRRIEMAARTCYKSEDMIADGSAEKLIRGCIKSGHESILEHASVTVKFVCDRGISHELVRHRLAAFSQESTRYCNYKSEKFGSDITFIESGDISSKSVLWEQQESHIRRCYSLPSHFLISSRSSFRWYLMILK